MWQSTVSEYGARPFLGTRGADGWQWLTYAEADARVTQRRASLAALGVGRGDRVAAIANNCAEWAIGAYATFTLGAVWVPMYEAQLARDWEYILADSGAKVCLARTRAIAGTVKHRVIAFDDLAAVEGGPIAPATVADDDTAMLIYTSGTTGSPKGVCLSHKNVGWQVSAVKDAMPWSGGERSLGILPWAHVGGGLSELQGMIASGGAVAICEDHTKLVDYLAEVRPTILIAVPRIWNKLFQGVQKMVMDKPKIVRAIFARGVSGGVKRNAGRPLSPVERLCLPLADRLIFAKIRARFGGHLKFAISGAAALSKEVAELIDAVGIPVFEAYGMTETSSVTTATTPSARRIGSVGRPLPGVRIEIDEGEVIIHAPGNMKGYYNLETEIRTPDGGIRTGDLGRLDEDGFLYITGRKKEIYKLENGKYVAPAPLEERITLSPFIAQAFVHGDNKPYNVALLVPDKVALENWAKEKSLSGDLLHHPSVRELLASELARLSADWKGYERIEKFALLGEELTQANDCLTPTLKVKRRNVLQRFHLELASLYGVSGAKPG
jgi:long-chain acyl-CoA synthetase